MTTEDKDKVVEEEIEILEEGQEPKVEVEEERLRSTDDDDEDEEIKSIEGETPEEKSARRKEERRMRRDRRKQAEFHVKQRLEEALATNAQLAKRITSVETHALNSEARLIDKQIAEAQRRHEYAENMNAEAIAKGDGVGAMKAERAKDEAAAAYHAAVAAKNRVSQAIKPEKQEEAPKPKPADPRVKAHATAFLERHKWLDPKGAADEDSAVTRAIDLKMTADGLDPADESYWTELEKRMKKRMPDRFKEDTTRKSPPVTSGSDRAGSGKTTFVLSKARKDAMILDGSWDDPVRRTKMVKNYRDYDLANAKK